MNDIVRPQTIPGFEGHPVSNTAIKVTGSLVFDGLEGEVIGMDDLIQVLTHFRCIAVHHQTDEKTGEITRVQVLRPIEMIPVPFDDTDPDDIGIRPALPRAISGSSASREDTDA